MLFMSGVTADKVRKFFEKYPEKTFAKRQVIVQAGEEPAGVFYLVSGRVNQYDISPAGAEVVVNVFQPPAFFPSSWAINRNPNQYFFEASTDVTARLAPADDVVNFLKSEPDVLFDLLARVYRGVDGLLRRMAHLMGGDARSRLLFEILNAAYRFGEPQKDGSIKVPLKEGDLARHSGLARETVNRYIQNLKTAGLVEVEKAGLVVTDASRLEAELGSDL
jgi:CRP-like cAMP-binding protein